MATRLQWFWLHRTLVTEHSSNFESRRVPWKILDQVKNFENFFWMNQLIFDKILSWRKVKIRTHQPPFTGMSKKLLHGLVELVTLNIRSGFRVFPWLGRLKTAIRSGSLFLLNPYQQTFIKNFINGRKLVLLDASKLSQVRDFVEFYEPLTRGRQKLETVSSVPDIKIFRLE